MLSHLHPTCVVRRLASEPWACGDSNNKFVIRLICNFFL